MRTVVVLCALATLLAAGSAGAGPTHYWQFESSPGFQSDSIGAANLVASGSPTQVSIPGSGRGSEFVALAGNAQAADLDLGDAFSIPLTLTNDFTIEVLVHLDNDPSLFGYAFAGFASGDSPTQVGWVLQTRQFSNPGPDNLVLATGFGGSITFFNPQIPLVPGKDYYLAVTFDTLASGGTADFRVLNLTDGGPAQTASIHIETFPGMNPIGTFVIGDDVNSTAGLDGLIDEVRLSDSVLPPDQLLIPAASPVPTLGPWAFGVLAGLIAAFGASARLRDLLPAATRWPGRAE